LKIAFISQPEYFRAHYSVDMNFATEVKEFIFHFSMSENDFKDLEKFDADINIFFRGEFFPNAVLKKLNGLKIAISSEPFPNYIQDQLNYTNDSFSRFFIFEQIRLLKFDYVFHYDKSSLQFLQEQNINLSGDFTLPVDTDIYKKDNLKKDWDIFFIGRSTPYREKFLGNIKHYNNILHIAHGIYGKRLVEYCNKSKIVLNLHAENEVSWEPRVQMLMATGGFLMSHKITPNDILIPNVDYVEVDMNDPIDLYEKVKFYLKNDSEREEIAKNGYQKIKKYFHAKDNFEKLIQDILQDKYMKFNADQNVSKFYFRKLLLKLDKFL